MEIRWGWNYFKSLATSLARSEKWCYRRGLVDVKVNNKQWASKQGRNNTVAIGKGSLQARTHPAHVCTLVVGRDVVRRPTVPKPHQEKKHSLMQTRAAEESFGVRNEPWEWAVGAQEIPSLPQHEPRIRPGEVTVEGKDEAGREAAGRLCKPHRSTEAE